LLWVVDFATQWMSLSIGEQERAEIAARRAGLADYLAWARRQAVMLHAAAAGDANALRALGIESTRRRDMHSIWRHVSLAATWRDRLHLLGAFLVPRRVRGSLGVAVRYTLARTRTRLRSLVGASRTYGPPEPGALPNERALRLERTAMVSLTRDVVGGGGALWVRAPGGSMRPAIDPGALARIGALPAEGLAVGDVVLALTADGEPVLHRAIAVTDDGVICRGDAAIHTDPFVPYSRVIGIATHVRDARGERPLERRRRRSIAVTALKVRRRIRRILRRA
jgi:hypothetical protein